MPGSSRGRRGRVVGGMNEMLGYVHVLGQLSLRSAEVNSNFIEHTFRDCKEPN